LAIPPTRKAKLPGETIDLDVSEGSYLRFMIQVESSISKTKKKPKMHKFFIIKLVINSFVFIALSLRFL
jgi:hypothetical protein